MSYALTAVAVRAFTGRLPDRVGPRRVLIPALFVYAAGVLLVPQVERPLALMLIGVMCGAGHGYAFPILNVLTVQEVSATHRGRAVSWFTAMFDLGNTLANPLLGAVAEWAGYRAMFTASGLGLFITTAVWRFKTAATRAAPGVSSAGPLPDGSLGASSNETHQQ